MPNKKPVKITTPSGEKLLMPWSLDRLPTQQEVESFVSKNRKPNPVELLAKGKSVPAYVSPQAKAVSKKSLASRNKVVDENFGIPAPIVSSLQPTEKAEANRRNKEVLRKQRAAAISRAKNERDFAAQARSAKETGNQLAARLPDGSTVYGDSVLSTPNELLRKADVFTVSPRDLEEQMMMDAAFNPRTGISSPTNTMAATAAFPKLRASKIIAEGSSKIYQGVGGATSEVLNPGGRRAIFNGIRKAGGSRQEASDAVKFFDENFGQIAAGIVTGGLGVADTSSIAIQRLAKSIDFTDFITGMGPQALILADPKVSREEKQQIVQGLLNPTAILTTAVPGALHLGGKALEGLRGVPDAMGGMRERFSLDGTPVPRAVESLREVGRGVGRVAAGLTDPFANKVANAIEGVGARMADRRIQKAEKSRIASIENLDIRKPVDQFVLSSQGDGDPILTQFINRVSDAESQPLRFGKGGINIDALPTHEAGILRTQGYLEEAKATLSDLEGYIAKPKSQRRAEKRSGDQVVSFGEAKTRIPILRQAISEMESALAEGIPHPAVMSELADINALKNGDPLYVPQKIKGASRKVDTPTPILPELSSENVRTGSMYQQNVLNDANGGTMADTVGGTAVATLERPAKSTDGTLADLPAEVVDANMARGALKPSRIPVSPLGPKKGFKPKTAGQIILDFGKSINQKITSGSEVKGALGTYNPTSGSVRIRYNDIDTASHEIGHYLDDRFGFGKDIPDGSIKQEIVELYAQSGKADDNNTATMYKEGIADFYRAVVLNPDMAKSSFPNLWKRYESLIPADVRKKIGVFSDEVRMAESVDPVLYSASQVRKPEQVGFIGKLRESFRVDNEVFKVDGWAKISEVMLNDQASLESAVRFIQKQVGMKDINPLNDPVGLGGDLRYIYQKVESYIENGVRSSKTGELISDAKIADIDKILAGDGKLKPAEYEARRDAFISFLINERTLEYERKFIDDARTRWVKAKGTEEGFIGSRYEAVAKRRAERGTGIGRGIRSDTAVAREGLDAFSKLPEDQQAQVRKAAEVYRQVASDVLDYGVQGGRWTKEWADAIRADNLHYAAMKRIVEDGPAFNGTGKLTQAKNVVKQVTGGTHDLIDPVIGLIENVSKTIFEVDRNNVMKGLRDLVVVAPREMYDKAKNPNLTSIMEKVPEGTNGAIKIFVDGSVENWRISDPALQKSLDAIGKFTAGDIDAWLHIAGFPGRVLRTFVTNSPGFIVRNVIRDSLQRPLVSDINMARRRPGDWIKFASADEKRLMRELGGSLVDNLYSGNARREKVKFSMGRGFYMEDSVQYTHIQQQLMRNALSRPSDKLVSGVKAVLGSLGSASTGSELKGRIAEFKAAYRDGIAKGMNDYEAQVYAARKSRELIDYLRAGKTVRQLNRFIPFLNASIQGTAREMRMMKRSPGKYATRFVSTVLLPTLLLRLWNQEQGAQEDYEQQPGYLRDMFFLVKVPGREGFMRIPKPFMAGVMGAGVERSLDYASAYVNNDKVGQDKAFEGYGGRLVSQFMLVDQSTLMGGAYAPFIEVAVNYDTFRRKSIIDNYDEGLAVDVRKNTDRSSKIAQAIAGFTDVLGRDIDPRNVDHILKSYTGDFGRGATMATDGRYVDDMARLNLMFGLFSGAAGGNSEDVQWVRSTAKSYGVQDPLKAEISAFYDATSEDQRNRAAKTLREKSRALRKKMRDAIDGKKGNAITSSLKGALGY